MMWNKLLVTRKKKSKVHCKKYKKIACKSINAVWKQDETTTKCMHECTISFLRKKAQKARFIWAKFQNIQPKFRQGIQFNRNFAFITYNYIVVNSLYYKELRTLGLKINCSVPKLIKNYIRKIPSDSSGTNDYGLN